MKHEPKPWLAQKHRKVSDEDFNEYAGGRRERRRDRFWAVLRGTAAAAVLLVLLCVGFALTETLLRVSEIPLPQEHTTVRTTVQTTTRPAPVFTPQGEPLHSFFVPPQMMDRRAQCRELEAQIKRAKSNTAVMLFKTASGNLTYRSNLMQQAKIKASQKPRYRTDWTLKDLKRRAGQRIVAVLHCFDDPLAATAIPEAAVLQRDSTQTPWKDENGKAWLNPYAAEAREYLLALVREVVAFGADELLLFGVRFPDSGNLEAAEYPGAPALQADEAMAARNACLRDFLFEVKKASGGVPLYVHVTPQEARNGAPSLGGDFWGSAVDRVVVDFRSTPMADQIEFWRTKPILPLFARLEDTAGARDYILIEDE